MTNFLNLNANKKGLAYAKPTYTSSTLVTFFPSGNSAVLPIPYTDASTAYLKPTNLPNRLKNGDGGAISATVDIYSLYPSTIFNILLLVSIVCVSLL